MTDDNSIDDVELRTDEYDSAFSAAARYAAHREPEIRWVDPRTGEMSWSRPVGIEVLLDAGASPVEDQGDDEPKIAEFVQVRRYKPSSGQWVVKIQWVRLDRRRDDDGRLTLLTTEKLGQSEVFDEREAALEWVTKRVRDFDAPVRDATTLWDGEAP